MVKKRPRNQALSNFMSTKSPRSPKSYRSRRRKKHLPWVLAPLVRMVTQSIVSITTPSSANPPLPDDEIDKELQEIYYRAKTDTSKQRILQPFWYEYCEWLKVCKNLEDSQSQIEYWTAKEEFFRLNRVLKNELNYAPIPRTRFQFQIPECVEYLSTLTDTLVSKKLGALTHSKVIFLLLQYTLNIVFISQQLNQLIDFDGNSLQGSISKSIALPKTRNEYIKSSIGVGSLVEFTFLSILIVITIFQLILFFISKSDLNKGILFLNFIINIQKTAEFSLFKFIHFLNPSSYITKFHEPPLLDFISDVVKFTLRLPKYEPKIIQFYKIFYTLIIKPLFSLLGLMALYIKLVQVSTSLEWLNRLNYDTSVFIECWNNYTYIINFLGLANNIAGLYGLQPSEGRQAFFINHRIHEYDFIYALLAEYFQNNQFYKGCWNLTLYTIGIDYKDLIEIFWETVYGEFTKNKKKNNP